MHKCSSLLNTLSSIANQTASLPLAMRFIIIFVVYSFQWTTKVSFLQTVDEKQKYNIV